MKHLILSTAIALVSTAAMAADKYVLDSSHSQILFSFSHLGYSVTTGMFSGFEGEITLDKANPAASSVSVTIPAETIYTGWTARDAHFKTEDFFGAEANPVVTFTSTAIELTGDETAKITGDLTMNGVTKPVVLDASLNQFGIHPQMEVDWAGFNATTTVLRSDFDMGIAK